MELFKKFKQLNFLNKNLHISQRYASFTLCEVIIVLSLIGIVAENTIPTLMKDFQNQVYVNTLKKTYTEFNQVLQQLSRDYGCINDLVCAGFFASGTTASSFGSKLVKYFRIVQDCGTGAGCWVVFDNYFDGTGGTGNQTNLDSNAGYYKFITTDGIAFAVKNYTPYGPSDCKAMISSSGVLGYLSRPCGEVLIDVNGFKGPNYWGKDVFRFYITNGKGAALYPSGGMDELTNGWWNYSDANKCSSTSTGSSKSGQYCTGRIMEKGWVIDY